MVRVKASILRLIVVLFPLISGSFLYSLGADKLNQAYLFQKEQWIAPNGLIMFSSIQAEAVTWAHLGMNIRSVKDNEAEAYLDYEFSVNPESAAGEQIGGFQIPYTINSANLSVKFAAGYGIIEADIHDENIMLIEEPAKATIIYGKFTVPDETRFCHLFVSFTWEGLLIRKDFSSYTLAVPFANANETIHKKVYECCPNASAPFDNVSFMIEIGIPDNCEFRGSLLTPNFEHITVGKPQGNIRWYFNNTATKWSIPTSNHFTVQLELPAETELRNRLLFDSGLYMGLGISLVFSGIYEALKTTEELTRKRKESKER